MSAAPTLVPPRSRVEDDFDVAIYALIEPAEGFGRVR